MDPFAVGESQVIRFARPPKLADALVEELRQLILAGQLPAGATLRQEELADRLGVSRTPLRAALRTLEHEGLVTFSVHGTASVVSLEKDEARELMEVREMVDGLAARVLASRGLSAEFDQMLSEQLSAMQTAVAASDRAAYLHGNAVFHATTVRASGHRYLQRLIPYITVSSQVPYLTLGAEGDRFRRASEEHAQILGFIRSGDAEQAEEAAREHVRRATRHWT
jgi:GntR family transcriptional regulator, vanillate catabolism transcriptional regulator